MTSGFQQMLKPPFRRFSSLAQVDHQPLQQRHSTIDIRVGHFELLQQPFPNHPVGVRPDAVPAWMIDRARGNNRILGADCHFGYADEVREWLVEVAEPLWSAGGAATASLGAGMKRKRGGGE